jgi:hypothetical protein
MRTSWGAMLYGVQWPVAVLVSDPQSGGAERPDTTRPLLGSIQAPIPSLPSPWVPRPTTMVTQ